MEAIGEFIPDPGGTPGLSGAPLPFEADPLPLTGAAGGWRAGAVSIGEWPPPGQGGKRTLHTVPAEPAAPAGAAVPVVSAAPAVSAVPSVPATPQVDRISGAGRAGDVFACVAASLQLLSGTGPTTATQLALSGFRDAADFAGQVEELSRTVEYLQVVAAGAVDRTRREAAQSTGPGAAPGWTTGWGTDTHTHTNTHTRTSDGAGAGGTPSEPGDPAGDGCRNTTEFLRARLRISAGEARRRLALSSAVLPRTALTGDAMTPQREELAGALAAGAVPSRSATLVTLALERVQHHAPPETLARMEHALTQTAARNDPDFLARIARRWTDAIDQDGTEPSEEELRHRQGAFIRRTRRGLHHLEIFATTDQFENLLTAMNTATNPRTGTDSNTATNTDSNSSTGTGASNREGGANLDRRTRQQQLLDGLVGACKTALTSSALPAAGGLRPQVMVTIDHRDLLARLEHTGNTTTRTGATAATPRRTGTGTGGTRPGTATPARTGTGTGGTCPTAATPARTGTFAFSGPVTAATIRKIACDADIIPILLGSEGRVLDIGRTTRIFPPHIRKAITARDQGCAFPNCTIPAPWCEAHHITYWSHGGTTSTENGTLLCSHHHHLIHKEQWTIQTRNGTPWFIPPPHLDPTQQPQRNHYFRE